MNQKIYEAVKIEWGKFNNSEQQALMYLYIAGGGRKEKSSWIEFLQTEFGILTILLKQ